MVALSSFAEKFGSGEISLSCENIILPPEKIQEQMKKKLGSTQHNATIMRF